MDILFAASELAPMIKASPSADVVASLSKALRLLGHKVTLALPRHPAMEAAGVMVARRLTPLVVNVGSERQEVTVFDGRLSSGVDLILLDAEGMANGPWTTGGIVEGDAACARAVGLFVLAVVELVRQRALAGTPFDVVHAHDWPAAMVPYLLREREGAARPPSVLTIHDVGRQGVFPREALRTMGLGDQHFQPELLEFYGKVNYLKGGILAADALTTGSTTYAREILLPANGHRLEGLLAARTKQREIVGIVSGVDYAVYNPMTDPALPARYDAEDASNKGICKSALLSNVGLPLNPDRPLVVSIGPFDHERGGDLLVSALPKVLKGDVSFVVAGLADETLASKLEGLVAKHPDMLQVIGHSSDQVVHRLLAAADIVVIPSRSEPGGLMQLYAQRYGALPVACRVGGFIDTIVDCDAALETGTGFLYDKPTAPQLIAAMQRSIAATTSPRWSALRRRVMRQDLGWDRPARRYVHVYRSVMANVVA